MGERAKQRALRRARWAVHASRSDAAASAASAAVAAGRRPPTLDEARALVRDARRGRKSAFGVVRCLALDLDAPLPARALQCERGPAAPAASPAGEGGDAPPPPTTPPPPRPRTLLEEAAVYHASFPAGPRRVSLVANQLLKAGADASCGAAPAEARALVRSARSPFAAHCAVQLARRRVAAREDGRLRERIAAGVPCALCGAGRAARALPFAGGCGHFACEACVWLRAADRRVADVECACAPRPPPPWLEGDPAGRRARALSRRAESLAAWRALPEVAPSAAEARGTALARRRFAALPAREAAALCCGAGRAKRTEHLLQAAAGGDAVWCEALVRAGVDVAARNSAGETALLLAAARGEGDVVRLLALWAGADAGGPAAASHCGCEPLVAAAAGGHEGAVRALLECGVDAAAARGGAPARQTALQAASASGSSGCVAAILEGAPPEDVGAPSPPPRALVAMPGAASVTVLVPPDANHAGAGAFFIDGAFSAAFLERLDALHLSLPDAQECSAPTRALWGAPPKAKASGGPARRHYADAEGWLAQAVEAALSLAAPSLGAGAPRRCHRYARYVHYPRGGTTGMAPHVDIAKRLFTPDVIDASTTHTLLLYLRDTPPEGGGSTVLLKGEVVPAYAPDEVLCRVEPRRGRLLAFPHGAAHAGEPVAEGFEKLLLRGEVVTVCDT